MKYTLKYIKDIYDKIPADRVEVFMKELTIAIMQTKNTIGLLGEIEKSVTKQDMALINENNVQFPETLVWNDDNKGEIQVNIHLSDKDTISVKTTVKEKP